MYTHTDLLLSVSQGSIFYILSTASLIEPWASNMGTLENDLDLWIEAGTYPIFYITGLTSESWKLQCNVWNSKSVSPYFSLKRKEIWDVTESRRTAWANEPTGVSLERTEMGCQVWVLFFLQHLCCVMLGKFFIHSGPVFSSAKRDNVSICLICVRIVSEDWMS